MIKLSNDTRSIELTSAFINKSEKDIATISALDILAKENNNTLVLTGGYATEAICGGSITRPHGDVDIYIILNNNASIEKMKKQISEILINEETKWIINEKNPKRVNYNEKGNETKDSFNKRRIEIHLELENESNLVYSKRKLIDSNGKEIAVFAIDLAQTVIEKIKKFYQMKDGVDTSHERHSSITDYYDLKRLLALKDLNLNKIKRDVPQKYAYVSRLLDNFDL